MTGRMTCVLGLDLSLTSTGVCVLPLDWGVDWSRPVVCSVGASLARDAGEWARMHRLALVLERVESLVEQYRPGLVAVEQYAFSRGKSQAHALGELGGVVKHALWRRGVDVRAVTASAARSLLGKVRGKAETHAELHSMGAPKSWNGDELDAFVVANWAAAECGGTGIYWREE